MNQLSNATLMIDQSPISSFNLAIGLINLLINEIVYHLMYNNY